MTSGPTAQGTAETASVAFRRSGEANIVSYGQHQRLKHHFCLGTVTDSESRKPQWKHVRLSAEHQLSSGYGLPRSERRHSCSDGKGPVIQRGQSSLWRENGQLPANFPRRYAEVLPCRPAGCGFHWGSRGVQSGHQQLGRGADRKQDKRSPEGNWLKRFDQANTKEMPFKITENETKPVQMMYQMKKLPYNYIPDHNLQILELPYEGNELSMFILLPENSVQELEKALTQERLDEWTNRENMDVESEIVVHLPKFKLEDDYELNGPLAQLGMSDVFCSAKADLSGMNGEGGLFLSTVVHKAFVEVNEEGTEAAAATAGMVSFCMLREEHFTADHPFLFFIRHNKTKSILFLGRFSSPQ
ncbi:hypothetical protein JOB18_005560 [Solea senegalensis]|uniref:Serpin domain-containing protein n=1 Tax=Solea senegalensis TaxID=28829 RepID=A0AAV6S700_SOLSE|nr:hypothetical protein JOB18_005560 [Solea senegalensis]